MKKKYITWMSAFVGLMMLLLTGCQSVIGVDLNKALQRNLEVTSYEGYSDFSVELIGGSHFDWSTDNEDLSFLQDLKFEMNNIKMQDRNTMSMDAKLVTKKGDVPFSLSITDKEMAIQFEGAAKPVYFQLEDYYNLDPMMMTVNWAGLNDTLQNNQEQLLKSVGPFIINNLPNPENLRVSNATEQINGSLTNLTRVHAEIKGSEVLGLVKAFIDNIASDEAALKEVIQQVYTLILAPIGEEMGEDLEGLDLGPALVDEMFNEVKAGLFEFSQQLDAMMKSGDADEFLNDNNYLTVDMYVDNNTSDIRKMDMELVFNNPEPTDYDINTVKIKSTSEVWNVNQAVSAEIIDTKEGLVLDESLTAAQFVNNLDPNSALYSFLLNDLKLSSKFIYLPIGDGVEDAALLELPYIDPVTEKAMVPLRFVAEELDSEVTWNNETQQATIVDVWTGKTIVLTIGSSTAVVDGQSIKLEGEAQLTGDTTYVPVRFIADQFGAEIDWDNEVRAVIITRD